MITIKQRAGSYLFYAILAVILLGLSYSRIFDEFEYSTLDLRFQSRPAQPVNDDIAIIHIGDDTIEKLKQWPIPRSYHAMLVDALRAAGARTVIFDIFFSEETAEDQEFAEAVKKAGNVYMAYVFEVEPRSLEESYPRAIRQIAPLIEPLDKACRDKGFINVQPDIDGKVRHVMPFIEYQAKFYPHITFLAVLNNMGVSFNDVKIFPGQKIVVKKGLTIPLERDSSMLVNYPAKWGEAFHHFSYIEILQSYIADLSGNKPLMDLSVLKGKICYIGFTAAASPDAHPSPLEPLYPGVGVHTSLYNSILHKSFLRRAGRLWNLVILLAILFLTGYITAKSKRFFAFLSIALMLIGFGAIAVLLFTFLGIWIDMFYPMITMAGVYVVFTFRKYLIETKKREVLEKELDIAKNIQQSFLPREIPKFGNFDINAKMVTARQVGGDLYNIVKVGDDELGIMLGDVSGKGVPAALFMARVVSIFKEFAKQGDTATVLKNVNEVLVTEDTSGLFVTLTYMLFDQKDNRVTFSSAGHLPVLYIKPDGGVTFLDVKEGMPLGLIESAFSTETLSYDPGSVFVLYTDGVTEAMNLKDEMFGQDRLEEFARDLKGRSAEDIVEAVHAKVKEFAGKADQHDDITVLVVRT